MPTRKNAPYAGVWSATPTPLNDRLQLDRKSLPRLVAHHLRLGIKGLFLAGTAGEGMMLPDDQRRQLVRDVVAHNRGRMTIAVQATDNSAARVLDNIRQIKEDGANIAVVAQPLFFMNFSDRRLLEYYTEIFDRSVLPIGLYDRGHHSTFAISPTVLARLLKHPRVILMKDSSSDADRMKITLRARRSRPELTLLNGDEFKAAEYMIGGYDGLLLGGAIFNGYLAGRIIAAVNDGRHEEARRIDARIVRINNTVFGGIKRKCWLSGQKRLCVELGIFSTWRNYYDYPLTPACEKSIVRLVQREGDVLRGLPG